MDAHFAVFIQIQHLRTTCARRVQASGRKWQEGIGVALTDQAILRQITEARTHGLPAPGVRIVGQWLSARHAINMKGA